MNKEEIIAQVLEAFFNLIDIEEIQSVEENCGAIWIEKTDGTTVSLSLIECEQ